MRHFIALMLEPELGGQLQGLLGPGPAGLDELGRAHPGAVRLHATEDLHLTLEFLGEFPAERRPALAQTLARALAPLAAPRCGSSRRVRFPSEDVNGCCGPESRSTGGPVGEPGTSRTWPPPCAGPAPNTAWPSIRGPFDPT